MLHFAFFFLRLSVASRNKIVLVLLWTLWSFGEVDSCNKNEFWSGLQGASEGLLPGKKPHSALNFVELQRVCVSEQNCIPLWTLEERVLAGNLPLLVVVSLLVILESSPRHYHTMASDCFLTQFKVVQLWFWIDGQAREDNHDPGMVMFGPLKAC
jgi:hypothetical protein